MKLSDFVAQYLDSIGISHVFGYQGGSITHLIESVDCAGITYIQNYNEQGSAMAADAYSRISDEELGVAIASNGPGATNLITGIANAYCDSVAALFLTGQVHTWGMKKSEAVRQESFQEIDIISMVKPITKYAVTVTNKDDILYELEKAVAMAKEGRRGPVLVDIPVDVQGMEVEPEQLRSYKEEHQEEKAEEGGQSRVEEIVREKLGRSKRPVLLVGGGVRTREAKKKIRRITEQYSIPVVCSLQGLDVMNHENPAFIGFIGSYGNRYANLALQNADLLIVLGSRLDLRQTGKNKGAFAKGAYMIHVDVDDSELKHNVKEDLAIKMDVLQFVNQCFKDENILGNWDEWLQLLKEWKARYPETEKPNLLLGKIAGIVPDNSIVVSDVGQNQMWTAQSLRIFGEKVRILNSGGLGAMGYSIPGAIGAYYGRREKKPVFAFTGDGGIQMNIQELCLIGNRKLPIKIFLLNNGSLGLIREIHEKYYNYHCVGSVDGFSHPDFEMLAKAYQISYMQIDNTTGLNDIQREIEKEGPSLFDIKMEQFSPVQPQLSGMDELDRQSPYLDNSEISRIVMEVQKIGK